MGLQEGPAPGLRKERRKQRRAANGQGTRGPTDPMEGGGMGAWGWLQVPVALLDPAQVNSKKSITTSKMETHAPLLFGEVSVNRSCQFPPVLNKEKLCGSHKQISRANCQSSPQNRPCPTAGLTGAARHNPFCWGAAGLQVPGNVWRVTVYCEVPTFAPHYPTLTEAADNSVSRLLASISRLLEQKI